MGDRAFAFVRTSGPKGFPWHTGREQEDLVLFHPHFREGGATTLPPDIEETFKMAPGVNPIFPAEGAFEIDVATPDGWTLPLRSAELRAVIEQRAGYAPSGAGRWRFGARERTAEASASENVLAIGAMGL